MRDIMGRLERATKARLKEKMMSGPSFKKNCDYCGVYLGKLPHDIGYICIDCFNKYRVKKIKTPRPRKEAGGNLLAQIIEVMKDDFDKDNDLIWEPPTDVDEDGNIIWEDDLQ